MITYLLDTGPLAGLLLGRPGALAPIDPWRQRGEVATSVLAYGEVVEYVAGFRDRTKRRNELTRLMVEIEPHVPSMPILDRYADLRRAMRPPRGSGLIGDIDTLIAATALEHELMVVTVDGDFTRVPGLRAMLLAQRTYALIRST